MRSLWRVLWGRNSLGFARRSEVHILPVHSARGIYVSSGTRIARNVSKMQSTDKMRFVSTTTHNGRLSTDDAGRILRLQTSDGSTSEFQSIWLRYNCHCPVCRQGDSGQKTIDITDINMDTRVLHAEAKGTDVHIRWSCGHYGNIPRHFLSANSYSRGDIKRRRSDVSLTDEHTADSLPTMTYSDLLESQENVLKWMKHINVSGMCLVTDVPSEETKVKEIALLIDQPQWTIYGEIFDVVSSPQPINIAYTNVHLDLHMDLMYYESPPGLQILHAVRYDSCVEGGDSVLLDAFQVAEEFKERQPHHFRTLTELPGTFQKIHYSRESPVHMKYQRCHIVLNHANEIVCVNWSPSFEGPLNIDQSDVERYFEAYRAFAEELKVSRHRLTFKLREGDLIIFNNRRMLHGRDSFELNGGVRHLRGCYVHIDHFKSRLQVLLNTIGDGSLAKRVGNQD